MSDHTYICAHCKRRCYTGTPHMCISDSLAYVSADDVELDAKTAAQYKADRKADDHVNSESKRLHPETVHALRRLIWLHGAGELIGAIRQIEKEKRKGEPAHEMFGDDKEWDQFKENDDAPSSNR